jgi:VWFA-related protein
VYPVLLAGVCAVAAAQQAPAPEPQTVSPPIDIEFSDQPSWLGLGMNPSHGRVSIDVAVTDEKGNAVTGLTQSDFKLLDEGQPMPLVSFADSSATGPAPGDPPVSVVLVLDEAGMLAAATAQHRPADIADAQSDLEKFLRSDGGRLAHPTTIYCIGTKKVFSEGPSQDGNLLAQMLEMSATMNVATETMSGPGGDMKIGFRPRTRKDTPLMELGAITIEHRRAPGRKLLFWIGPGWGVGLDSASLNNKERLFDYITEFSTRMREARVELFVVTKSTWGDNPQPALRVQQDASSTRSAEDAKGENLSRQMLALKTGGEMTVAGGGLDAMLQPGRNRIPRLIAEHIAVASTYYRLTFDPPRTNTVDEYHKLTVELDQPGLTAHTDAGYYDEPDFYDQPTPATVVTVAQLEQRLEGRQSDSALAGELAGLKLTERLSTPRLEAWLKRMPGNRSREALTALADASVFLRPPADEVLPLPQPDAAAKGITIERVAAFLARQYPRLPDFYALRTSTQYGEPKAKQEQTWKTAQPDRSLGYQLTRADDIYFDHGKETTHEVGAHSPPVFSRRLCGGYAGTMLSTGCSPPTIKVHSPDYLETKGTFGPILDMVLQAATSRGSTFTWSHWEKGPTGPTAVYDYSSPADMHAYGVGFCCLAIDEGEFPFHRMVAFHGELDIDPETGHILRLSVVANLEPRLPLKSSAIMVEYGPVELGGTTYFCPLRSVSIWRQRRVFTLHEWDETFKLYGPFKTVLTDVTFNHYHLAQGQVTILPGFTPVPQQEK